MGRYLSLIATWYDMFSWYSWKTCPLLNRSGGEVYWGLGRKKGCQGEGMGGEGGWSCDWDVKTRMWNKLIKIKIKNTKIILKL